MVHRCADAPYESHSSGCRLGGMDDWYRIFTAPAGLAGRVLQNMPHPQSWLETDVAI